MNQLRASEVLATIQGLFTKADWTDEITALWLRKISQLKHDPQQVIWAAGEHRMQSKYHNPDWAAIKGLLSNAPIPGENATLPDAAETECTPEWLENFDRKRQRTRDSLKAMTQEEINALAGRAADRLDAAGCGAYAKRVRELDSSGPLGGSFIAALENQLAIERRRIAPAAK